MRPSWRGKPERRQYNHSRSNAKIGKNLKKRSACSFIEKHALHFVQAFRTKQTILFLSIGVFFLSRPRSYMLRLFATIFAKAGRCSLKAQPDTPATSSVKPRLHPARNLAVRQNSQGTRPTPCFLRLPWRLQRSRASSKWGPEFDLSESRSRVKVRLIAAAHTVSFYENNYLRLTNSMWNSICVSTAMLVNIDKTKSDRINNHLILFRTESQNYASTDATSKRKRPTQLR